MPASKRETTGTAAGARAVGGDLPRRLERPKITRAPFHGGPDEALNHQGPQKRLRWMMVAIASTGVAPLAACARPEKCDGQVTCARPRVVVVAPAMNLSNSREIDVLQVTDMVASELLSFEGISVIPVNLTLSALARRGQSRVHSPADARDLAVEFAADATVVTAVTEYDPYEPPRVGLVMQWYAPTGVEGDDAGDEEGADSAPPNAQVQRVFDASRKDVVKAVREYARTRDRHESPLGWRRHVAAQQLYLRYACWETIRTMLSARGPARGAAPHDGVEP